VNQQANALTWMEAERVAWQTVGIASRVAVCPARVVFVPADRLGRKALMCAFFDGHQHAFWATDGEAWVSLNWAISSWGSEAEKARFRALSLHVLAEFDRVKREAAQRAPALDVS
jgi:hypothetical protein